MREGRREAVRGEPGACSAHRSAVTAEWQRWGSLHGADAWQLVVYMQLAPGRPAQLKGSPDMRAIVVKHKPSACNPATSVSLPHCLLPSLLAPGCLWRDSAPRFGLISPCWLWEAFKALFSQVADAFAKPVLSLLPRRLKLCVFLVLFPICFWSV